LDTDKNLLHRLVETLTLGFVRSWSHLFYDTRFRLGEIVFAEQLWPDVDVMKELARESYNGFGMFLFNLLYWPSFFWRDLSRGWPVFWRMCPSITAKSNVADPVARVPG
jgi:hypothetical protein